MTTPVRDLTRPLLAFWVGDYDMFAAEDEAQAMALANAIAHSALRVGLRILVRKPAVAREQSRERRLQGLHFVLGRRRSRHLSLRLFDQRADFRRVDEESEAIVIMSVARSAHRRISIQAGNGKLHATA